jgi:hypothetical protein
MREKSLLLNERLKYELGLREFGEDLKMRKGGESIRSYPFEEVGRAMEVVLPKMIEEEK